MFSVLVWGCNWILFIHGWFCPIRLIHLFGRKFPHFEKARSSIHSDRKWTTEMWMMWVDLLLIKRSIVLFSGSSTRVITGQNSASVVSVLKSDLTLAVMFGFLPVGETRVFNTHVMNLGWTMVMMVLRLHAQQVVARMWKQSHFYFLLFSLIGNKKHLLCSEYIAWLFCFCIWKSWRHVFREVWNRCYLGLFY